jgi:hypothetical protein
MEALSAVVDLVMHLNCLCLRFVREDPGPDAE